VSPIFLDLFERLLDRRLEGKRQPKISSREHLTLSKSAEGPLLSEHEREDILSSLEGLELSLEDKTQGKQFRREMLEKILSRPPLELAQLEAVSLVSFQSWKTKSTGKEVRYKFKVKLISMPKASQASGEVASSSELHCLGEAAHAIAEEAKPFQATGSTHDESQFGARSESSFSLSLSILEACASKLAQDYRIDITGQQLHDLLTSFYATSDQADVESAGGESSSDENDVSARNDDVPANVIKIIRALGPDEHPKSRSLGSFQKYCMFSVKSFGQAVIAPHLETAPVHLKFEGGEIPKEAVGEIQSMLADTVMECFSASVLSHFFVDRRTDSDTRCDWVSTRIINRTLKKLASTLKQRLSCTEDTLNMNLTLGSLKQILVSKTRDALEEALQPLTQKFWQISEVCAYACRRTQRQRKVQTFQIGQLPP